MSTTPASAFPAGVKPFSERAHPRTICMFDVDGTLSLARQKATPEMIAALKALREKTAIAFVGGSDLNKIVEQLSTGGNDGECGLRARNGRAGSWTRSFVLVGSPARREKEPR